MYLLCTHRAFRAYRVRPWGVEPQSLEPESNILSIELWTQSFVLYFLTVQNYKFLRNYTNFMQKNIRIPPHRDIFMLKSFQNIYLNLHFA